MTTATNNGNNSHWRTRITELKPEATNAFQNSDSHSHRDHLVPNYAGSGAKAEEFAETADTFHPEKAGGIRREFPINLHDRRVFDRSILTPTRIQIPKEQRRGFPVC
ncbi:MAG TPA: hypothetical protein VNI77_03310 [Nitrososphaera sp.]|nr:hypothetical protein [Nitrososphaera sp.]